jgi:hypothetical protein
MSLTDTGIHAIIFEAVKKAEYVLGKNNDFAHRLVDKIVVNVGKQDLVSTLRSVGFPKMSDVVKYEYGKFSGLMTGKVVKDTLPVVVSIVDVVKKRDVLITELFNKNGNVDDLSKKIYDLTLQMTKHGNDLVSMINELGYNNLKSTYSELRNVSDSIASGRWSYLVK